MITVIMVYLTGGSFLLNYIKNKLCLLNDKSSPLIKLVS